MTDKFGNLIQFAARNRGEGTLVEPRFYYDVLNFQPYSDTAEPYSLVVGQSDPDSFKNSEQFPVRITHVVVSPQHYLSGTAEGLIIQRPSAAQRLMLRLERYGEYYMNEMHMRSTAWHNVQNAPAQNVAMGTVTHTFAQPVVLSARDSLRVEFDLVYPTEQLCTVPQPSPGTFTLNGDPASAAFNPQIDVQFTGVGILSGRPYFLAGPARRTSDSVRSVYVVDPSLLQNIGHEPIALTDMTVTGNSQYFDPQTDALLGYLPDVRMFRIQVRQQGNGTQANWFRGPTFPEIIPRMPLALLGTHVSNSVVHRLPGDGIQLDPGEMIRVSGQNSVYGDLVLVASPNDVASRMPRQYHIGLAGYLMVT